MFMEKEYVCPKCGSNKRKVPQITPYGGAYAGNGICDDCGYSGTYIIKDKKIKIHA